MEKIWIINGTGDEGNWEIQAFGTLEKAVAQMKTYIEEFIHLYPDAEWEVDDDYWAARYDDDNHYDSFWIEELMVK